LIKEHSYARLTCSDDFSIGATLWVYDLRTDQEPFSRRRKLQGHHLDDFVRSYKPSTDRGERTETERFKSFALDDLLARDRVNLDITWSGDPILDHADNLQPPEKIAQEIADDLKAALYEIDYVAAALQQLKSERENRVANP
jgi:type I restriction enzyme M protein